MRYILEYFSGGTWQYHVFDHADLKRPGSMRKLGLRKLKEIGIEYPQDWGIEKDPHNFYKLTEVNKR